MGIPELPVFAPGRDPIADFEALQRAYRDRRRRHAKKYSTPYSEDISKPAPGVLPDATDEEG